MGLPRELEELADAYMKSHGGTREEALRLIVGQFPQQQKTTPRMKNAENRWMFDEMEVQIGDDGGGLLNITQRDAQSGKKKVLSAEKLYELENMLRAVRKSREKIGRRRLLRNYGGEEERADDFGMIPAAARNFVTSTPTIRREFDGDVANTPSTSFMNRDEFLSSFSSLDDNRPMSPESEKYRRKIEKMQKQSKRLMTSGEKMKDTIRTLRKEVEKAQQLQSCLRERLAAKRAGLAGMSQESRNKEKQIMAELFKSHKRKREAERMKRRNLGKRLKLMSSESRK